KGQDHALALWGELPPAWRARSALLFVGPATSAAERQRLEALRNAAPDADRVHFPGPTTDPLPWIRTSAVYLTCSASEGMPLGPIEAACSGLPCLVSAIPGHAFLGSVARQYPLSAPDVGARHLVEMLEASAAEAPSAFLEAWQRAAALRARCSPE